MNLQVRKMLPVKADLAIFSSVIGVSGSARVCLSLLSYKLDFSFLPVCVCVCVLCVCVSMPVACMLHVQYF